MENSVSSALGKYAAAASTFVIVLIIVAGVASHVMPFMQQDPFVDMLTFGGFTYLFGQTAIVNGWKAPVQALHRRMDAAGVPPAADPTNGRGGA